MKYIIEKICLSWPKTLTVLSLIVLTLLIINTLQLKKLVTTDKPVSSSEKPVVKVLASTVDSSCLNPKKYWQDIQTMFPADEQQAQAIIDYLEQNPDKGCVKNKEFQQALFYFFSQQQKLALLESSFIMDFSDKDSSGQQSLQQQKLQQQQFELYQQKKESLAQQVEDNLLPNESFDQVYARALNELYQEVYGD